MIDIVIPNLNGLAFLPRCLESLRAQTLQDWHLILVDNASADGSVDFVRTNFPEATLVLLEENQGFSAAVNAGIAVGNAPLVFLLNNDTELAPDCLAQLRHAAQAWPEAGFFAARLVNFQKRHLLDGAGEGFFRGGAGYRLGTMEKYGAPYDVSRSVFGACGGAALYRRQTLAEVGEFDPDFFAYLEDVDWNLRAVRLGKICRYVAEARVYHMGSATTGSKINELTIRLSTRNSLLLLARNYPAALFLRYSPLIAAYQLAWLLFVLKKRQLAAYVRGLGQALCLWPGMRRKFYAGLGREGIAPALLRKKLAQAEDEAVTSIMRRRAAAGRGNGLLKLYKKIFL